MFIKNHYHTLIIGVKYSICKTFASSSYISKHLVFKCWSNDIIVPLDQMMPASQMCANIFLSKIRNNNKYVEQVFLSTVGMNQWNIFLQIKYFTSQVGVRGLRSHAKHPHLDAVFSLADFSSLRIKAQINQNWGSSVAEIVWTWEFLFNVNKD